MSQIFEQPTDPDTKVPDNISQFKDQEYEIILDTPQDNLSQNIDDQFLADKQQYRKMGFYKAVKLNAADWTSFSIAKEELNQHFLKEEKNIEEGHEFKIKRFWFLFLEVEKKLNEEKQNLRRIKSQVQDLKDSINSLEYDLEQVGQQIIEIYELIDKEKGIVIEKRLDEVRSELDKLISSYEEVTERKNQISNSEYQRNKAALDLKVKRFQEMKEFVQSRYQDSMARIKALNLNNLNSSTADLLTVLGTGGALAAGYFFSIFAIGNNLDNEDVLFFFLSSVFQFNPENYFSGNKIWLGVSLLSMFILLLSIIALFSWVSHKLLKKYEKGRVQNNFSFNIEEKDLFSYRTQLNNTSNFTLFLQLLPIIFTVGFLFLLVLLSGNANSKIQGLDITLAAQVIGGSIALIGGCLSYLYVLAVLEPKLLRKANKEESSKFAHWELKAAIIIFCISLLALPFAFLLDGNQIVSTALFAIISMATSVVLGFAFRFKGLLNSIRGLEVTLVNLSYAIEHNSRPHPMNIHSRESKQFRDQYLTLQKQMYMLIREKNSLIMNLVFNTRKGKKMLNTTHHKKKNKSNWFQAIIEAFSNKAEEVEWKELSPLEERLFPSFHARITQLKQNYSNLKNDLIKKQTKIELLEIDKADEQIEAEKRCESLEKSRRNYLYQIDTVKHLKMNSLSRFSKKCEELRIDFQDGFELGIWYCSQGLSPALISNQEK